MRLHAPEDVLLQCPSLLLAFGIQAVGIHAYTHVPWLSQNDIRTIERQDIDKQHETDSYTLQKLFSNSSYKHEVIRKEHVVNKLKRSLKIVSN